MAGCQASVMAKSLAPFLLIMAAEVDEASVAKNYSPHVKNMSFPCKHNVVQLTYSIICSGDDWRDNVGLP